jgi:rhodanese-related sulfurtransferase
LLDSSGEAEMETLTEVARISPEEVARRGNRGESFTFIDARNPQAWGESDVQLPGAIRVPADEVGRHLREIPRDRPVVAYCT